jgi:hypothetical protein
MLAVSAADSLVQAYQAQVWYLETHILEERDLNSI